MPCTIVNDKVGMVLGQSTMHFDMVLEDNSDSKKTGLGAMRQTRQNPDLSRLQLAAHLRRAERIRSEKPRESHWTAFLADRAANTANANVKA